MNNKKYFNCKDENGYMKKDREWIDKFKALYSNYTADELIAYEIGFFSYCTISKIFAFITVFSFSLIRHHRPFFLFFLL